MTDKDNNSINLNDKFTQQVINTIAEKLEKDPSTITLDSSLVEDLGADSLDLVELVMEVEEQFKLEIPDTDAAKLSKVRDIVQYINDNQK